MTNRRRIASENIFAFLGIVALGLAWWQPLTLASCILGWLGAMGLAAFSYVTRRPYLSSYLASLIAHTLAFYWLFFTIGEFGGFGILPAALIFGLFISISALQFPLYVLFLRHMPQILQKLLLAPAVAWIGAEFLSVRIFPWYLGHTQYAFNQLCQIADLAGAATISFLMMWAAAVFVAFINRNRVGFGGISALIFLAVALVYGSLRQQTLSTSAQPEIKVALVQANISTEKKHDIKMFRSNIERYREMTAEIAKPGLLIIWPESVIHDWIKVDIRNASDEPMQRLPWFKDAALLTGSLSYQDAEHFYNSAIGVKPGGDIAGIYHKRILMPFGEYTPFGDIIPYLRDINSTAADFTAGEKVEVIDIGISAETSGQSVRLSPLICYEDLLPSLSRESVRGGANLLVNLTNDAWFGDSPASRQHHLIAAFRAIENRRVLLRSTNTGLTAVVDVLGRTTSQLPTFSDGVLEISAPLFEEKSIYSRYLGEKPWWVIAVLNIIILIISRFRIRGAES